MPSTVLASTIPEAPFDAVAASYDDVFTNSLIGRAQRASVWQELDAIFHSGQRVLEINCGTGVDAVHLACCGVEVRAFDASPRMIELARERARHAKLQAPLNFQVLPTEELAGFHDMARFDGAFSNFAGLNCVADLPTVARNLAGLLRPGAIALLCLFSPFCAWEAVWYLSQGNLRKAFRRLRRGRTWAQLAEGVAVEIQYPSVRGLRRAFAPYFHLRSWKGIGVVVPPSYASALARRVPNLFRMLAKVDPWLGRRRLLRCLADHILLTFERVTG